MSSRVSVPTAIPSFDAVLSLTHPKTNEKLSLLLFAARDISRHAVYNEVVRDITHEIPFVFSFGDGLVAIPSILHLVLFSTSQSVDGIRNEVVLAWGSIHISAGKQTSILTDACTHTQATMKFHCTSTIRVRQEKEVEHVNRAASAMMSQVQRVYSTLTHTLDSYLCWVVSSVGRVPVLPFIASIADILTCQKDNERGEAFLEYHFRIAGANLQLTDFHACSTNEKGKWVAEMCTLVPRAMIYTNDSVRIENNISKEPGMLGADQWVRLFNFPHPNRASVDCEDCAISILEVLYLLQHIPFTHSTLQAVRTFLRPYTACFVFGSLRCGVASGPHAYVALLDSNFIQDACIPTHTNKPRRNRAPTIVIEGTARVGGVWDDNTLSLDTSTQVHGALMRVLDPDAGYDRVIRNETNMHTANEQQLYGDVYAILSGDHSQQAHAIHLLAVRTGTTSVGVSPDILFGSSADGAIEFHVAASYNNATNSPFKHMCNSLPMSHIPCVPENKIDVAKDGIGEFHVDIHYETYMRRKTDVQSALLPFRNTFYITEHIQQLSVQLNVMQFWFKRK